MAEAQRETIAVQRLNTVVVLVHLVVVLALWWAGQLAIPLIFGALAVEWSVAGWLAARMYRGYLEEGGSQQSEDTPRSVFREFWRYCRPYLPYAALGFAHDFADRWMLQHWGGSSQQAYYAIAQQYAGIALLATASVLRIFWKEVAEANHRGDYDQMERLYGKASRGLFFLGALTTGALMPWASEIINLSLGTAYSGGSVALMLMFIYPVHQSLGQIGGSMLFATEKAQIFVILGVTFMALSIIVAYLLMAPVDAVIPGLNLAAEGLAWKMVTIQIVSVNLQAWFIARIFKWKFDWAYQVVALGLAISIGWWTKVFVAGFLDIPSLQSMALSATLYLVVMLGILLRFPSIAGLELDDLKALYKK
jgi:O-antigen/teichoic acid export membrane protein